MDTQSLMELYRILDDFALRVIKKSDDRPTVAINQIATATRNWRRSRLNDPDWTER